MVSTELLTVSYEQKIVQVPEAYAGPSKRSMIYFFVQSENFDKKQNPKPLNIFTKRFIIDVRQGLKFASAIYNFSDNSEKSCKIKNIPH